MSKNLYKMDWKVNIYPFDEFINKKNCPQCGNDLKNKWIPQEEQEKLTFDLSELGFKLGSYFSQIECCFCSNCGWQHPSLLVKDKFENILLTEEKEKYQKERELVEKITTALLPNQPVKIRFVKSNGKQLEGETLSFKHPQRGDEIYSVCFFPENLQKEEKKELGNFLDTLAHELAHASNEVFKNSQYNTKNYYCSCKTKKMLGKYHKGEGHDKTWHDKYDEFRERIKKEKLAEGSGYTALGKDFMLSKYKDDGENDPKKNPSSSPAKSPNKDNEVLGWVVGTVIFILFVSLLVYFLRKRKKAKK
jgi:hypothetical protein